MRMQLRLFGFFMLTTCLTFAQTDLDSLGNDSITVAKEKDPVVLNFFFSYYEQDGVRSPVTGGIGDEALKDFVGKVSVTVPINERLTFNGMGGMDYYTSASTDNINNEFDSDPLETSASHSDQRKYTDLGIQIKSKNKRHLYGFLLNLM